MMKFLVLFICFGAGTVTAQVVTNVRLVDHQTYYVRLINELMNEVERREWCNFKLPDIHETIDQTIYGWHLNGNVTYANGFIHSLQSMDLAQATLTQIWTYWNGTSTVTLGGNLRLHEVALAFDVEVTLEGEPMQHFTGMFTHESVTFATWLHKVAETGELSTRITIDTLSAGTRRMIFMPETNLTQVLQRQYLARHPREGINAWATEIFAPIMLNLATNVIPFPTLCYNCNA